MIHLHLHSYFSVLDGLGSPAKIVERAKEIGAPAVAISDHASISALPELMNECKAAGIKPIIGCEFYLTDEVEGVKGEKRYHLSVWAKNWAGVESIMERLTLANTQFYHRPRLQWRQALEFKNCIVATACCFGVLGRDNWDEMAKEFYDAYGADFYLEVMPHNVVIDGPDLQEIANKRAMNLASRGFGKLLATNDAHYVRREDHETHKILMAVQYNKKYDPADKGWGDGFCMRTIPEMVLAFKTACPYLSESDLQQAMLSTIEVADKVEIKMPKFTVELPSLYPDDNGMFRGTIGQGWQEILIPKLTDTAQADQYLKRLTYEIGVIGKLGFVRYFLIVHDVINWARENGIMVGPARGSAAGSLVCYLMGITQVDPIEHGLYFERFLNPERIDLPDIDVDFQDSRREEVFAYIRNKYGHDKTAQINTFGQLSAKSAFRDVCRVFDVHPIKVNTLSKLIDDSESFETDPELSKFAAKNPKIIEQTKKLEGVIRNQGVHACGLVVSSAPLEGSSVIEHRKGTQVVNWDKRECENFGLLKIDVLGLKTLSILSQVKETVKANHGVDLDFPSLTLDDPKVFEAFSEGRGIGVFQFENSGMQALLRSLKARDFETITATTALFRPGSLNSGQTERYAKIVKGDEYETYVCPEIKPILEPTKGVMVYQEQIMRIFVDLGGFSWAHADKMRKIIGKKLGKDEFNKHRDDFLAGCKNRGIDDGISNDLFNGMVEFAAYSFNKSHAVAYTMISYWTMFAKVNYPAEFTAAYLTHTTDENRVTEMVREARRMGVAIKSPDINISTYRYEVDTDDNAVVAPIGIIKGVGAKALEEILAKRSDGPFLSIEDMQARVVRRTVNKGIIDKLSRAGAFEGLGVREADEGLRAKNMAELLPIFDELPQLRLLGAGMDRSAMAQLSREYGHCGKLQHNHTIDPWFESWTPSIMVINNPVKREAAHFTSDGTRHFLKTVEGMGFCKGDFYYTSPVKCQFEKPTEVPKECQGKGFDILKKEIEIVKPKLILVFASQVINLFADKKPTMAQLHGKVKYHKGFDCYVMFSYSPQYAYYQEDKAGAKFFDAMATMRQIFV